MITKEEQYILDLNSPLNSYMYCKENKNANIKLHEDVIVKNKNEYYAYCFAKDIHGADIERLQKVIINSNNLEYICHFAFIQNSNKEELFRALLKIGDKDYINYFIKNIPLSEEIKTLIIFM